VNKIDLTYLAGLINQSTFLSQKERDQFKQNLEKLLVAPETLTGDQWKQLVNYLSRIISQIEDRASKEKETKYLVLALQLRRELNQWLKMAKELAQN